MDGSYAIEMLNITKRFPGIIANDNITLQLRKGEIHALLGENGAGKSTRTLSGIGCGVPPDGGRIWSKPTMNCSTPPAPVSMTAATSFLAA